jgi:membrane-bound ClpP family serine protease
MEIISLFLLITLGLLLLLVELFFVPGTTFLGLLGFGLSVWGIVMAFSVLGPVYGTVTALVTTLLGLILAWLGFKSGLWRRFSLHTRLEGPASVPNFSGLAVGDTGQTLSDLRPSGNAVFKGSVFQVATLGRQVPAGTQVRITKIADYKLIVEVV